MNRMRMRADDRHILELGYGKIVEIPYVGSFLVVLDTLVVIGVALEDTKF